MKDRKDWDDGVIVERDEQQFIRPYLLTNGRAQTFSGSIAMETIVERSDIGAHAADLVYERADIVEICAEPRSVAEISAHLKIPLGTARVVIEELVVAGYLLPGQNASSQEFSANLAFVRRIISGVKKL